MGVCLIIKIFWLLIWVEMFKIDVQCIKDLFGEYDYCFFDVGFNMFVVLVDDSELFKCFWVNEENVLFVIV